MKNTNDSFDEYTARETQKTLIKIFEINHQKAMEEFLEAQKVKNDPQNFPPTVNTIGGSFFRIGRKVSSVVLKRAKSFFLFTAATLCFSGAAVLELIYSQKPEYFALLGLILGVAFLLAAGSYLLCKSFSAR